MEPTPKQPKNLYEYIDLMKIRTAMYIGDYKISTMYHHISGYEAYCYNNGINENLNPSFRLFNDFVANYYSLVGSTAGWKNMILAENYGDEQQALEQFFKIFDLFRENSRITDSRKILFKLLSRIVSDPGILEAARKDDDTTVLTMLLSLPEELEEKRLPFEYIDLLQEIEQLAKTRKYLKKVLSASRKAIAKSPSIADRFAF